MKSGGGPSSVWRKRPIDACPLPDALRNSTQIVIMDFNTVDKPTTYDR